MIKIIETLSNGRGLYHKIYSDKGVKILDKRSGVPYDNEQKHPMSVDVNRYNNGDYEETDEPIEVAEQ